MNLKKSPRKSVDHTTNNPNRRMNTSSNYKTLVKSNNNIFGIANPRNPMMSFAANAPKVSSSSRSSTPSKTNLNLIASSNK